MDDIMWPFTNTFIVVYLDDILIYSKTWAIHLQHIQQVLHTLRQHKLYANLEKFSFNMEKVHYLGYIIDQHGVHVDPTKIQVIRDWPAPTTLTELQSFLGLANFYRRFVLGFSHIAWALIQTKTDFVNISSLGDAYQYVLKIKHKFRHQNKWKFGSANP